MSGADLRLLEAAGFPDARLVRLAGDASTRTYDRVVAGSRTAVLADFGHPLAEPDADGTETEPWLRWQAVYLRLGLRVPAVHAVDRAAGLVLIEDLGDELLQSRVETRGAEACAELYHRAVELLRTLAHGGLSWMPAGDADDPLTASRLALEMDFFLAHAMRLRVREAPPGRPALEAAQAAVSDLTTPAGELRELLWRLCRDVAAASGDLVACHRDYHARNLMVLPGDELAVVDFQDTRRGPRAYDLASLVFDPYVQLPDPLIDRLIETGRPLAMDEGHWRREVDLVAGQRLIKAAGSYAWLGHVKGRRDYLQWLEPALSRAMLRLARWPHGRDLARALRSSGLVR